jgi:hypothetical protein
VLELQMEDEARRELERLDRSFANFERSVLGAS